MKAGRKFTRKLYQWIKYRMIELYQYTMNQQLFYSLQYECSIEKHSCVVFHQRTPNTWLKYRAPLLYHHSISPILFRGVLGHAFPDFIFRWSKLHFRQCLGNFTNLIIASIITFETMAINTQNYVRN